MIDITI